MEHSMGQLALGRPEVAEMIRPAYPKIAESYKLRYQRIVAEMIVWMLELPKPPERDDEYVITDAEIVRTAEELGIRI